MREETDLRLGIEADYVAGREDRPANFLDARDWDYVVGSVHFVADEAVDMDEWSVWARGRSPEKVWRRYFETVGEAARTGMFDIMAHPDLVKVWGRRRAGARAATCAATTSRRSRASSRAASRSRSRPPGCASRWGRSTRPAASSRRRSAPGCRSRSRATRTPDQLGYRYERGAVELLEQVGVGELCVFEGRQRRLEPIG